MAETTLERQQVASQCWFSFNGHGSGLLQGQGEISRWSLVQGEGEWVMFARYAGIKNKNRRWGNTSAKR